VSGPIVIAGGGTGGHVFVAEAVATALCDRGVDRSDLRFIGSERGQERELLAESGIELVLLPGRGIQRSLSPSAIRANLGAVLGIVRAFLRSFSLLRQLRPAAVVSVGGYAAAPVGIAAAVLRRPLVLVNVDAVPGLTHRVLGRFSAAACVAFPGTPLENATVTGAPVRPAFAAIDAEGSGRRLAAAGLGVEEGRHVIAVLTGSLGARSVNEAVLGLADRWRGRAVTIYHVTGRRDFADLTARWVANVDDVIDYRQVPFEPDVPRLYQAADVAITRAGALTVAELAMAGLPAVLIPLPGAPGDHQTLNARALAEVGGGILMADSEVSSGRLDEEVGALLAEPVRRAEMAQSAHGLAHVDAAGEVAEVVLSHVA
jgi:undecaprenyldiphospho-muramoylpentapeptide beta-N-acetylglucosaminyltransferase